MRFLVAPLVIKVFNLETRNSSTTRNLKFLFNFSILSFVAQRCITTEKPILRFQYHNDQDPDVWFVTTHDSVSSDATTGRAICGVYIG